MRTMINLLPVSLRRQQFVQKRLIQWCSIAGAMLAAGWMWHLYEGRESVVLSHQLESLEREHAPSKLMLGQLMKMRNQLDELHQQELVAQELEHQRNTLTLLGVISQTAKATEGRLRVTKLELTEFQTVRAPRPANENGPAPAIDLLIGGVAMDSSSVAEFLDGLQDSGIFSHVELSVKERQDGDLALRDYEMKCAF
jgi:hypothetical protein